MSNPTTSTASALLPRIESRIVVIRKRRVMVDADPALLYGVTTRRLNEQVKRNAARFPGDFMFQLDAHEKTEVVANCDHLAKLKFSEVLPYAFTEHGAIQVANVLAMPQAVEMGIFVVRAFVRMRELMTPPDPPKRPVGFVTPQDKNKSQAKGAHLELKT